MAALKPHHNYNSLKMSNLSQILPVEQAALDAITLPISIADINVQLSQVTGLSVQKFKKTIEVGQSAMAFVQWFKDGGSDEMSAQGVDWTLADVSEKVFRWSAKSKHIHKVIRAAQAADQLDAFVADAEGNGQPLNLATFNKWVKDGGQFEVEDDTLTDADGVSEDTDADGDADATVEAGDVVSTFCYKGWSGDNLSLTIRLTADGQHSVDTSSNTNELANALDYLKSLL